MSAKHENLSRRERQIMDALYELEQASAQDIQNAIPDAPSYSSVRALLAKLKEKGHIEHKEQGAKYIYFAKVKKTEAGKSAAKRLVKTFFQGSVSKAVTSLLDGNEDKLTDEEFDELQKLIEKARKK